MVHRACKVSVITPVKNGERSLERTIKSVLTQSYQNIEYIIVDGDSTDGTIEIIEKYRSRIILIRGKDKSIADAMNKGMNAATGDLIGVLNADDYYFEDAVSSVVEEYIKNPESIIHGNMVNVDKCGGTYLSYAPYAPDFRNGQVINHPATFIPKSAVMLHGEYDPVFKIVGDWELFLRYQFAGVDFRALNLPLVCYEIGGVSTRNPRLVFAEMHSIRKKYKIYKTVDFRYIREKILLFMFGDNVISLSHRKRIFLYQLKCGIKSFIRVLHGGP